MDDQRVGRVVRALRRRRGWRQIDLAQTAGCSQRTVSRAESGHLPAVPILRRILAAADASLSLDVHWRAGALDRLLDEAHAAVVGQVAELAQRLGWSVAVEVTYAEYGERGSFDLLAFWPRVGTLLVIEIKSDLVSVEATLRKMDEKVRLAPRVAHARFGWQARLVARILAMPESSTLRRRVARQDAVLNAALPTRGAAVRTWLGQPDRGMAGIWWLSPSHRATVIRGVGGRERVRRPKCQPPSHAVAR
ncbi:MAG TPA: helix-turn-helix domain-containing protein [Aeromicrobium sp.]|nr:helix-turn-helix domain-containing protein [Aeromicrobium sp.]